MVNIDLTKNNASNLHLATPEGELESAVHAITQSVQTMRDFLDDAYTQDALDRMSKNDMIFAIRDLSDGLSSIEVTGASSVEVGSTIDLVLNAKYLDGRERNVTSYATWESSDDQDAAVAGGVVTGVDTGTVDIDASYLGETYTHAVTVTSA